MTHLCSAALLILVTLTFTGLVHAADEPAQPTARERLKARISEDAKKVPAKSPGTPATNPPSATAARETTTSPTPAGTDGPATLSSNTAASASVSGTPARDAAVAAKSAGAKGAAANAAAAAPTVLPKVEVKKSRITVLDHERALQDIEIAREKKNLEVSEVDNALNDSKLARPLAIFGGDSTQFRKGVASERVQLMEAEKDLIEAIAYAKTKEEKAALQKQLNELKAMRRELDKTMR